MKSKKLSKQDREEILKAVSAKALAKWEASPLHEEMVGLEAEADKIIYDKQLEMIPDKDRKVLDKYGYGMSKHRIYCFADAHTGKVHGTWRYNNNTPHFTIMEYRADSDYSSSYPEDYPRDNSDFVTIINATNPALLRRYCELWNLRECEVDAAKRAFGNLLEGCNTTKQVYENESLRPFMPAWMLDYEKTVKRGAPATTESEAAIIADLTEKED